MKQQVLEKMNQQILACVVQAGKGVEKKGAKLLSIEASAKVKAAQAEAKQEAKAAAKRKRQEDKQAEKAELKRSAATYGPLSLDGKCAQKLRSEPGASTHSLGSSERHKQGPSCRFLCVVHVSEHAIMHQVGNPWQPSSLSLQQGKMC